MNNDNNILQELQKISLVVANLPKDNLYFVKPDYFHNLADAIVAQIRQDKLLEEAKSNTYIAPKGYFTDLAEKITDSVLYQQNMDSGVQEELNSIAPVLNTINKNNIYFVPKNYFETIKAIPIQKKQGKLIQFTKFRKLLSYTAAAVIIGILGTGVIQYMKINTPAIVIEKEIEKSSDEEIDSFLKMQPHTDYVIINNILDGVENTSLFDGTNTDEIKEYLKDQPETVENFNDGI